MNYIGIILRPNLQIINNLAGHLAKPIKRVAFFVQSDEVRSQRRGLSSCNTRICADILIYFSRRKSYNSIKERRNGRIPLVKSLDRLLLIARLLPAGLLSEDSILPQERDCKAGDEKTHSDINNISHLISHLNTVTLCTILFYIEKLIISIQKHPSAFCAIPHFLKLQQEQ